MIGEIMGAEIIYEIHTSDEVDVAHIDKAQSVDLAVELNNCSFCPEVDESARRSYSGANHCRLSVILQSKHFRSSIAPAIHLLHAKRYT